MGRGDHQVPRSVDVALGINADEFVAALRTLRQRLGALPGKAEPMETTLVAEPITAWKRAKLVDVDPAACFAPMVMSSRYGIEGDAVCYVDPSDPRPLGWVARALVGNRPSQRTGHRPPVVDCRCGWYACESRDALDRQSRRGDPLLRVELSGRVVRHNNGVLRAERQKVVAIEVDERWLRQQHRVVVSKFRGHHANAEFAAWLTGKLGVDVTVVPAPAPYRVEKFRAVNMVQDVHDATTFGAPHRLFVPGRVMIDFEGIPGSPELVGPGEQVTIEFDIGGRTYVAEGFWTSVSYRQWVGIDETDATFQVSGRITQYG